MQVKLADSGHKKKQSKPWVDRGEPSVVRSNFSALVNTQKHRKITTIFGVFSLLRLVESSRYGLVRNRIRISTKWVRTD